MNSHAIILTTEPDQSQRKKDLHNIYKINPLHQLRIKQLKAREDFNFLNLLSQSRLESCSSIINLFILLLNLSLVKTQKGKEILGYFIIAQVCFFYLLVIVIKIWLLPKFHQKMMAAKTDGFALYEHIYANTKQIKNLTVAQLQLLYQILLTKISEFKFCFPNVDVVQAKKQVQQVLRAKSPTLIQLDPNIKLQHLKEKQQSAIKTYTFWTVFVVNKCFSFPGVLLLLFIILPLTAATPTGPGGKASGWISVAVSAIGVLTFICIKLIFADKLQKDLKKASSTPFSNYSYIYAKIKQLKNFSIKQLEQLESSIKQREGEYRQCFPNHYYQGILNLVMQQIKIRLPKRQNQQQDAYFYELQRQEKAAQLTHANWLSFVNNKTIPLIINILKFLIVMDVTLSFGNLGSLNATGIIGIVTFVFGYIFLAVTRLILLPYFEEKVLHRSALGFQSYRLVYYEGKRLAELEKYQLQDIKRITENRKDDFNQCFPKTNADRVNKEVSQLLLETPKSNILQRMRSEKKERDSLAYWSSYSDSWAYTSIYSAPVLYVQLIVSLSINSTQGKQALGYLGIFTIIFMILSIVFLKMYWIPHVSQRLKQCLVEGFSEYNLVYNGAKTLKEIEYYQLQKIKDIIVRQPDDFKRCFYKINIQTASNDVNDLLALKAIKNENLPKSERTKSLIQEREELKRQFIIWKTLNSEIWFVLIPVWIVFFILTVQTIIRYLNDNDICCWVAIAGLIAIFIQVLLYNFWLKHKMEGRINALDYQIIAEITDR